MANPRDNEKTRTKRSPRESWQRKHYNIQRLIAYGGLAGLCVLSLQWCEMRKSTDAATQAIQLAKESSHLDQRAWVAHMEIQGTIEYGKEFEAVVRIKNTGKTFAKNLTFTIAHEALAQGQTPDFTEDIESVSDQHKSVILLAPGGETGLPIENKAHRSLTREELNAFTDGTATIFVHGKIVYDDVFNCRHWTKFCFYLLPNLKFRTYNKHNDADNNECP
jgi:hypothetical protein